MQKRIPILISLLTLAAASPAQAQERSIASCWLKPGPLPACRNYIVTEAAVEIPLTTTIHSISAGSTEKDFDTRFTLSLGFMHNMPDGKAGGIIVGHDVNRSFTRIPTRVEGRFRQWKGTTSAFDVSAGVSRKGFQNTGDVTGLTAAVGGEWRYIGGDARVEMYNVDGRTAVGGFVGARATSVAAPVAALAVFGAVAALIMATGAGY